MNIPKKTIYEGFYTFEVLQTPDGEREVLRTSGGVSILLHDTVKRRIILVEQPRASLISDENPDGLIVENVAGRFDVRLGAKALAVKEAWEEVGVRLREDQVELLNDGQPMTVSAGATDELAYLAYAEITPDQIEPGEHVRGVVGEGERVTRVFVSLDDLDSYICQDMRVWALIQHLKFRLATGHS
ncbi:MAG: hypothetical protein O3A46_12805 [Candidatus Poribacteria bacterium]|nr:hypothetical protein [Candidatus Poribacteria bacterium]